MVSPVAQATELVHRGELREALRLLERGQGDEGLLVALREWYIGERLNEQAQPVLRRLAEGIGAEAHVSRSVQALLGGDPQAALGECRLALEIDPGLATAHNHLGRALHNLGQGEQALQAFRRALAHWPAYPQAWQNIGHVMRAAGRMPEAVEAYRKALELAPAYGQARLNLGITLSLLDQPEAALEAFDKVLAHDPGHVEALVNAGLCLHMLGRKDEARDRYLRAIEAGPSSGTAWCYLGILLNEEMDTAGAIEALGRALELDPGDMEARAELAGVYEQSNRLEAAREAVESGLRIDPWHPALRLEQARLERRAGDVESALRIMESVNAGHLPPRLAQQYHFELGQILDRHGDHDRAFDAFTAGNGYLARSLRRTTIDREGFGRRVREIRAWLAHGAPGGTPPAEETEGGVGEDLCFLLGFPRSGTTLLDTILNAHPDIASIEERPTLERVIDELRAREEGYPACLAGLSAEEITRLRAVYRAEVSRYLPGGEAPLTVDKLPLRTLNAGLVNRLFPGAKILFALRHPCDVVLSNFMQQYAHNEAFIHFDTLADSAGMYDLVMGTWAAYEETLQLNVCYTRYEDLVEDTESEVRRICAFLGVEPHPAMLDAQSRLAARGRVRTNSYQQVAEPVYRRSAGRWLNYRRHFSGVLGMLEPYAARFGYGTGDG